MAAYFRFTDTNGQPRFAIQLRDEAKIAHARRILAGEETQRIHIHGRIIKRPVPYNPGWSFHLDPDTIDFFDVAIEVCDSSMQYLEDHLSPGRTGARGPRGSSTRCTRHSPRRAPASRPG
jgi:hypothetical protein